MFDHKFFIRPILLIMKKLIFLLFPIFFCFQGNAARDISSFDIARWYLDADLVLVCNVLHTDTVIIQKHDSIDADGYHILYDVIREKYLISVDSVIKGAQLFNANMDSIFTPDFSTPMIRQKAVLNSEGDTLHQIISYDDFCHGDSYFRIKSPEKQLVILRKTDIGYVIDYKSYCDSLTMELIQDVKAKGEDYFNFLLSSQQANAETLKIYPNPVTDKLNIEGVQPDRIEIADLKGKKYETDLRNPQCIDLSALNPGVYMISVFEKGKRWSEKIVKH